MWDWAALVGTAKVLATVVAHLRMCAHQSKLEVLVRTPTSSAVRELLLQGYSLGACAIATPWMVNTVLLQRRTLPRRSIFATTLRVKKQSSAEQGQ